MRASSCLLLIILLTSGVTASAAAPTLSYDGQTLSLFAENQTFGQVMGLFQRQTGLEVDIPGDLNALRLPLVEIKNLNVRDALLKVLEGSNYDYILVASPDQPDRVRKLVVPGKSAKISASATATAFRSTTRPLEDPFGGGVETSIEENSNVQPEPSQPGSAQPASPQNPPVQGLMPGQPGAQPAPTNPNQLTPQGVAPQQAQPQGLQPFNPFGNQNQNNRRSPY